LRSFVALPRPERGLALRALWALLLVRVGLAVLPFRPLRAAIDHAGPADGDEDLATARAVRRAVDRAARTIPGSSCLARAFAAEILLRRAGARVRSSIGVSAGGSPLDAHAWVESAGVIVAGDATDLARYTTLLVFGDGATADGRTAR
jgi:hypothetical protein